MKHWIAGIAGAVVVCASMATMPATQAAPAKKGAKKSMAKKPAAKMIAVRICPISGDKVDGNGAGVRVVKNYKAYFC